MLFSRHKTEMVSPDDALPGRDETMPVPATHDVLGNALQPPFPDGFPHAIFAMGCFWGAEQRYWETPGVHTTAVGYAGGYTRNPTYQEVCSGRTGHAEAVLVVWDPTVTSYENLLKVFWENHDPTQGMRQGNDVGTQYRSAIYTADEAQLAAAEASRELFQEVLTKGGFGPITTEIAPAGHTYNAEGHSTKPSTPTLGFFYAEPEHQQYLAKNPNGYCGLGSTGMSCPVGVARSSD